MRDRVLGYGAALLATAVWSGNFVTARALYDAIPPWQLNFWRWVLALAVLLPFAAPRLRDDWPALRRHWRYLTLQGLVGVTLMNTCIYKAAQTTASLNMALIMPTTPVVIMLLARVFLGEAITGRRLAGMAAVMAGIVTLVCRGQWQRLAALQVNSGDLWTLGGMLCFALYSFWMRRRPQEISPMGFNAAVFALGLLCSLPCTMLEAWLLPSPRLTLAVATGVAYAGLGCSALAFWLWTVGIDRIGPVRAGIIYYSLPLFAGLGSMLVLGETVGGAQVAGGALIAGGMLVATTAPARR